MIRYLIEKEFKQILRNKFLPRLIIAFPCMVLLILPWAANMEVSDINLCITDNSHSSYSGRLVRKAAASEYFNLVSFTSTYSQAMQEIEAGRADLILEIPATFEQELMRGEPCSVLISTNTVNGSRGSLGGSYLANVVHDFSAELRAEQALSPAATFKIVVQNRFNPHLDYKAFMVPALMVMILTMLCGFLPALNIVSEKEKGTIEQINVTPVSKFSFILAKLIPYWIIGFLVLSLSFALAALVYGLFPTGHLYTIYLFAILYVLTISGFGLVVSNYSTTMQQSMFIMYFFVIIFLLMSGLFTPINSMPQWAQNITLFNPLKYFIQVMRQVYLKGSTISDLHPQLIALSLFALFSNGWAILSYRKSS